MHIIVLSLKCKHIKFINFSCLSYFFFFFFWDLQRHRKTLQYKVGWTIRQCASEGCTVKGILFSQYVPKALRVGETKSFVLDKNVQKSILVEKSGNIDRSYIECYVVRCVHCTVWKPREPESDQRGHTVTLTAPHSNNTHSRKRAEGHEPGAAKCWSPSTRWQRA